MVENVQVAFVKPSYETETFFKDSMIVVSKNTTENALDAQYSVTRYWQNPYNFWLESEYLFDLSNGPYDDFFIFDQYAIVIDSDKKVVSAAYFDEYRGDVVPPQDEKELYDDLEFTSQTIDKVTFWD